MRNFVKGMDKAERGFEYLRKNVPNVSDAKINEGIFMGPQIRELMQDKQSDEDLNENERNAWLLVLSTNVVRIVGILVLGTSTV